MTALERAGLPADGLRRLAAWLSRRSDTRSSFYRSVSYPFTLMITGSLVYGIAFHTFLMPLLFQHFESFFSAFGAEMPPLTRVLAGLYGIPWLMWSSPLPAILYVIGVLVLCAVCARWFLRFSDHRVSLLLPYLGDYLRLDAAVNFCDTLATLLGSEVPLPEAVRLAGDSVSSGHLRSRLRDVAARVEEGEALGEALREARVFPPVIGWRLWSAYYGADFTTELGATADSCRVQLGVWEQRIQQSARVVVSALAAVVLSPVAFAIFALYQPLFALLKTIS
jgi:type II secretory pathway component PulF